MTKKSVRSKTTKRTKSKSKPRRLKSNGAVHAKSNGVSHHAGKNGRVATVTFRIPITLKNGMEGSANNLAMTTTRWVVEAITDKLSDKPPAWWLKATRQASARA